MNCKPGDLAILVRSKHGNAGKVVLVVRPHDVQVLTNQDGSKETGFVWLIDPPLPTWGGVKTAGALDHDLRPIRDTPGEDETLTWAPRKEPV